MLGSGVVTPVLGVVEVGIGTAPVVVATVVVVGSAGTEPLDPHAVANMKRPNRRVVAFRMRRIIAVPCG